MKSRERFARGFNLTHAQRGDYVWAFHDSVEIGPKMLGRIAKHTGLQPDDLQLLSEFMLR